MPSIEYNAYEAPADGQQDQNQGQGQQQSQNQSGVDGDQNNGGESNNNDGQDPLNAAFWNGESEGGDSNSPSSASRGDSEAAPAGTQQQQQNSGNPVNAFEETLKGLSLSGDLISTEIQEALNQGDYKGFNEALQTNSRETVKQASILAAKMTQEAIGRMTGLMESKIQEALGAHKDTESLNSAIPSAADAAFGPIVKGLYDQARKGGKDHDAAVKITKAAMAQFTKGTAADTGVKLEGSGENTSGESDTDWNTEFGPLGR